MAALMSWYVSQYGAVWPRLGDTVAADCQMKWICYLLNIINTPHFLPQNHSNPETQKCKSFAGFEVQLSFVYHALSKSCLNRSFEKSLIFSAFKSEIAGALNQFKAAWSDVKNAQGVWNHRWVGNPLLIKQCNADKQNTEFYLTLHYPGRTLIPF